MTSLFIGLTALNLLCLSFTAGLGYISMSRPFMADLHVLAGAMTALVCCGVHCVVFTYFIATSKWLRHATLVKHLDVAVIEPTRSFKAQAFPAAIAAMVVVFFTMICGAASANYGTNIAWHHLMAILSLATNSVVAALEWNAIHRNARLIDRVLEIIRTNDQFSPTPSAHAPSHDVFIK